MAAAEREAVSWKWCEGQLPRLVDPRPQRPSRGQRAMSSKREGHTCQPVHGWGKPWRRWPPGPGQQPGEGWVGRLLMGRAQTREQVLLSPRGGTDIPWFVGSQGGTEEQEKQPEGLGPAIALPGGRLVLPVVVKDCRAPNPSWQWDSSVCAWLWGGHVKFS